MIRSKRLGIEEDLGGGLGLGRGFGFGVWDGGVEGWMDKRLGGSGDVIGGNCERVNTRLNQKESFRDRERVMCSSINQCFLRGASTRPNPSSPPVNPWKESSMGMGYEMSGFPFPKKLNYLSASTPHLFTDTSS